MSYVCVADVQNHKAELAVLILVQLMYQLSVVSLQRKAHIRVHMQKHAGDGTCSTCLIYAEQNFVIIALILHTNRTYSQLVAHSEHP